MRVDVSMNFSFDRVFCRGSGYQREGSLACEPNNTVDYSVGEHEF